MSAAVSNNNLPSLNYTDLFPLIKEQASKHELLSLNKVSQWRIKLGIPKNEEEIKASGNVTELFNDLNRKIGTLSKNRDYNDIIKLIGRSIYQIEQLKPFKTNNTEIALLVGSYISCYFGYEPIVVKNQIEQKWYSESIKDESKIELFVKEKMRDVFLGPQGEKYLLHTRFPNAGLYYCKDTDKWHLAQWS